ncbi:MAG TPA: P63C domain-containing protein [Arachidicoccus sp.]|nr:P63C domain-containing protein [Arachidicoccus sp.]
MVYKRLAPGIIDELKKVNPAINGKRKVKHTQWLTDDIGITTLRDHLIGIIALAKANSTWIKFYHQLSKVYPIFNTPQLYLFDPEVLDDEETLDSSIAI